MVNVSGPVFVNINGGLRLCSDASIALRPLAEANTINWSPVLNTGATLGTGTMVNTVGLPCVMITLYRSGSNVSGPSGVKNSNEIEFTTATGLPHMN